MWKKVKRLPKKDQLRDIASYLAPNPGDEAWLVDPDQPEHPHAGQTTGETHADGYYIYNDGNDPQFEKYHSDDK